MDVIISRSRLYSFCGVYGPQKASINVSNTATPDYREVTLSFNIWDKIAYIHDWGRNYCCEIEKHGSYEYIIWLW